MNAPFSTPASTSVAPRAVVALASVALVSLLLIVPGGARAARPGAPIASTAAAKSRFDKLSVNAIHGGVLVRASVLPGSQHVNAHVSLLLRRGSQGTFKSVQTLKLAANDRNFAFLDHIAPGRWGVKVQFKDPGHATEITSNFKEITVTPIIGFPMTPGSLKVKGATVTYSGSVPHPKSVTQVQLLGLDAGPVVGAKGPFHTAAGRFKVLATTTVSNGTGTVKFMLQAKVKQGERWTFVLERSFGHIAGIDYAGLKTVRVS